MFITSKKNGKITNGSVIVAKNIHMVFYMMTSFQYTKTWQYQVVKKYFIKYNTKLFNVVLY